MVFDYAVVLRTSPLVEFVIWSFSLLEIETLKWEVLEASTLSSFLIFTRSPYLESKSVASSLN